MSIKIQIFIFAVTFLVSLVINEYNISTIKSFNPENKEFNTISIVEDETIWSIDNEYYLSPVINYREGKGWKRSPGVSDGDYFRRVPGYSIFYYVFVDFFGYKTGHKLIKFLQLLLFSLSIVCLYLIFYNLTKLKIASFVWSIIIGISPLLNSWLYFTLTESITPALMIFHLFFLMKAFNSENDNTKIKHYTISSFILGITILTRPYTAIFLIPLGIFSFYDLYLIRQKKIFLFLKNTCLIFLLPFMLVGIWGIRNYYLTSEFVFLEKAYHPQSLDRMKPEFEGMLSFVKSWGEDGSYFNTYHQPMYVAALKGDSSSKYVDQVLSSWPFHIINYFGEDRLYAILNKHQNAIYEQKIYFDKSIAMPSDYLPNQLNVQKEYHKLIEEYKRDFFFQYWFVSPLIYLKKMVLHSGTSHFFIFNEVNRGNKLINLSRLLLVIIHVLSYSALFINLFIQKNNLIKLIFVYCPFFFILFFTVIHREIEQRYMLPILPLIFANLLTLYHYLYQYLKTFSIFKKGNLLIK
jgi:hypothetical protein